MQRSIVGVVVGIGVVLALVGSHSGRISGGQGAKEAAAPAGWTDDFSADKDSLESFGRNPYFILEPGYQLVLEGVTNA